MVMAAWWNDPSFIHSSKGTLVLLVSAGWLLARPFLEYMCMILLADAFVVGIPVTSCVPRKAD